MMEISVLVGLVIHDFLTLLLLFFLGGAVVNIYFLSKFDVSKKSQGEILGVILLMT